MEGPLRLHVHGKHHQWGLVMGWAKLAAHSQESKQG